MDNIYIADIQFFRGNDKELILKSFSYAKLASDYMIENFVFKPPFAFNDLNIYRRNQATNVTKNIHRLHWNDGFIDYSEIKNIICSHLNNATEVIVKGAEKKKYLDSILERGVCYNIEQLECPNLKSLKMSFTTFYTNNSESGINVSAMKIWTMLMFQNSMEYVEHSIKSFHSNGFFNMSPKEIYFLPLEFLLFECGPDFLSRVLSKLPPHIVQSDLFKNQVGLDVVG